MPICSSCGRPLHAAWKFQLCASCLSGSNQASTMGANRCQRCHQDLESDAEKDAGYCGKCEARLAAGHGERTAKKSFDLRQARRRSRKPKIVDLGDGTKTKAEAGWRVRARETSRGRVYDVLDAQGTRQTTRTLRPDAWAILDEELES